jgi:hypothetical protein
LQDNVKEAELEIQLSKKANQEIMLLNIYQSEFLARRGLVAELRSTERADKDAMKVVEV